MCVYEVHADMWFWLRARRQQCGCTVGGCLHECGGGGVGGLVHDSSGKQPTSSVGGILSEKRGVEGSIAGCCILGGCSVWGIHQAG